MVRGSLPGEGREKSMVRATLEAIQADEGGALIESVLGQKLCAVFQDGGGGLTTEGFWALVALKRAV